MTKDNVDLHIVMFTYTFPYGNGEQFLETEIKHTSQRFRSVTIVPSLIDTTKRSLPENVLLDLSLANTRRNKSKRFLTLIANALTSKWVYKELFTHQWIIFNVNALKKLFIYYDNAYRVSKWLRQYIAQTDVDLTKIVFYTVWLVPQSIGIGIVKQQYPQLNFISRAHRDDIYENDSNPPYIPFRKLTFQALNNLFVISEHGQRYVYENYSHFSPPTEVARVGVKDPGFDNSASLDGVFRIVSCSFMIPVKRLGLFIQGLKLFAEQYPDQKINWQHIGDGSLRENLTHLAQANLPSNVVWGFRGHLSNTAVMAYYRENPVDVFINVSESEGIPAAIMEAQSCGIPCIATSVGGNTEIVNDINGVLLTANPPPKEISSALEAIKFGVNMTRDKRAESKTTWQTLYNAEQNYELFIDRIIELYS